MLLTKSELKSKQAQLRKSAKNRNIAFDLSVKDLDKLFRSQTHCYYFGSVLLKEFTSVDRKDSSKGYTVSNIVLCHKKANDLKNQLFENQNTKISKIELNHFFNKLIEKDLT